MADTRNRLKILRIHADLLIHFFQMDGKRLLRSEGMPEDAKIVSMNSTAGYEKNELLMQIHSESFPEVRECCTLPEIKVFYHTETPEAHLERKGIDIIMDSAGNRLTINPGFFKLEPYKPDDALKATSEEGELIGDLIATAAGFVHSHDPVRRGGINPCFTREEELRRQCGQKTSITIEAAGVDPAHQTVKCDFCACPLADHEGIQTCTQYRHVTLCEECYKKAGNTVR